MGANSSSGAYKRVETSGGIRASLAGRYASALFDLARDQRQIDSVGRSLDALGQALLDSKDFAELVASPLVSRDEAGKAFASLAPQLGLDPITLIVKLDAVAPPPLSFTTVLITISLGWTSSLVMVQVLVSPMVMLPEQSAEVMVKL